MDYKPTIIDMYGEVTPYYFIQEYLCDFVPNVEFNYTRSKKIMSNKTYESAQTTLGKVLIEEHPRDAVHVAVLSVTASCDLTPGQPVNKDGNPTFSISSKETVGIVDPFLPRKIFKGESFWIMILPRTVISLRHIWQHPGIPDEVAISGSKSIIKSDPRKKVSVDWILNWLDNLPGSLTYPELMDAANKYLKYGQLLSKGGTFEGEYVPPEFWKHYSILTDTNEIEDPGSFFSCSC